MRKEVYDVEREPRPEKVAVVDEVREKLDSADAVIVTEYRGLSVSDLAALRRSMRDAGGEYRVYKNTLFRRSRAGYRHCWHADGTDSVDFCQR